MYVRKAKSIFDFIVFSAKIFLKYIFVSMIILYTVLKDSYY